jgi:hypothetical protein
MPNTPHGLPYPAPTDPVAQGAAAMQALALAVEKLSMWTFFGWRFAAMAATGVKLAVALDTIERNDFTIAADKTYVTFPDAGIYVVTVNANFTGASGSGGVDAGVDRKSAADVLVTGDQVHGSAGMNGFVSAAGIFTIAAGERIKPFVSSSATGSGHNLTRFQLGVARIA